MIVISDISLQRGTQFLLEKASLRINPGQHIGITGRNGCGKSSLFQLLQGEIQLEAGSLSVPPNWRLAHMAQEVSSSDRTALDYVLDGDKDLRRVQQAIADAENKHDNNALAHAYAELEALHGYDAHYRAEQLLHGLGFLQAQCHLPVNSFSGGWRIRLNLAQALISRSDLLLLDEPTNHLDLEMREALTEALLGYSGALVVISHDRHLLRNSVDEFWRVHDGEVSEFDGTLEDYHQQLNKSGSTVAVEKKSAANAVQDKKAQRQESAQLRQALAPLRKRAGELEKNIAGKQKKLADIEQALSDSALYEAEKKSQLQKALEEQGTLRKQIEDWEVEWFNIQEQLENNS